MYRNNLSIWNVVVGLVALAILLAILSHFGVI
jgi:hypothetical protein